MLTEKSRGLLDDENPIPASQRPEPDLYETHPVLVRALMGHVSLPKEIWEPCAGKRAIADELERGGHTVLATDKFDHGCSGIMTGVDFLTEAPVAAPRCIVTNPPFNISFACVERALAVSDVFYFLMRVQFVNRGNYGGRKVMKHLAGFYPLAPRPARMHLDGWTGAIAGGRGDYAWMAFSKHHMGPADFRPLYWRDYETSEQLELEAAE